MAVVVSCEEANYKGRLQEQAKAEKRQCMSWELS